MADEERGTAAPDPETTAKKTTRKTTRKTAARKTAAPTAPAPAADQGRTGAAEPAAAKKTARKRAAKATTAATAPPAPPATPEPATAGEPDAAAPARKRTRKKAATAAPEAAATAAVVFQAPDAPAEPAAPRKRTRKKAAPAEPEAPTAEAAPAEPEGDEGQPTGARRRRRRGRRGRGRGGAGAGTDLAAEGGEETAEGGEETAEGGEETAEGGEPPGEADQAEGGEGTSKRRRRRRRRSGTAADAEPGPDDPAQTVVKIRPPREPERTDEVRGVRGSTRLEAKRQRRREERESGRRRAPILTEAEFLARRESVERTMLVRQSSERTQIAVLEDGVLVEHYITRANATSSVGNVYLGKVQNVLPSMEAAFVDIGRGRNAVLYAGEVNYDASGLEGRPRRIEQALKSGQAVLVQVTKDPIGHKGARLTSQVSLPGRYMVFVPDGRAAGISRKLPETERSRLKAILRRIAPDDDGIIIRTAAEGASEEELTRDLSRLRAQWEDIRKKAETATAPAPIYTEPDLVIRVVRDIFNEDFTRLLVQGADEWDMVEAYLGLVAPDLADRAGRWTESDDLFAHYRVDEQLAKALDRKVWLPSGGSLVIDRTEAMTVIDVNTGRFTGAGGNLEETVTRNNLEAAEEIVRQLRLRDLGGIIVIDFIDMVLESNRDLVLRRLVECLGRDRTRHQVSEFTSLGLVQLTRKRVGEGLLEAFSETCPECNGRGVRVTIDPFDPHAPEPKSRARQDGEGERGRRPRKRAEPAPVEAVAEPAAGEEAPAGAEAAEAAGADAPAPKRRRRRSSAAVAAAAADSAVS